jgi:hypothetical protein
MSQRSIGLAGASTNWSVRLPRGSTHGPAKSFSALRWRCIV